MRMGPVPCRLLTFGAAVGLAVASGRGRALDFGEWLEVEGKSDEKAVQEAKCWCKEIRELVSSRIDAASSELHGLETSSRTQHFENEQLKLTVKEHSADAEAHAQSLDEAAAINDKEGASGGEHSDSLEQALHTIRAAMKKAEDGSAASGTLSELEGVMSQKLQALKANDDAAASRFDDLRAAKQKMLRLSKAAAAEHQQRLAAGQVAVAQANAQIEAYTSRRDADNVLTGALREVCEGVEADAEVRAKLRQDATLLNSQVKSEQAQQKAQDAAEKLFSLAQGKALSVARVHAHDQQTSVTRRLLAALELHSGRSDSEACPVTVDSAEFSQRLAAEALDGAKASGADLMKLVAKGGEVEMALANMLQAQLTAAHITEGRVGEKLKASVDKIFTTAQAHRASVSAPFQKVQADGRQCTLADGRLVTELMSAKADAGQQLVDAKRCNR